MTTATISNDATHDAVTGAPRVLLGLEGAALLAASVAAFGMLGGTWWVFAVLLLTPDLAMLGYLVNLRVGTVCYNAAHTTIGPVLLGGVGVAVGAPFAVQVATIWLAHIGMDRTLGFGLKYPTAFRHSHLG